MHKKQHDVAVKKAPVVVKDCPCPVVAKWAVFTGEFEFVWDVDGVVCVKPAKKFHAYFEVLCYCWYVFKWVGVVEISPDVFVVGFGFGDGVGVGFVGKGSVKIKVGVESVSIESYSKR